MKIAIVILNWNGQQLLQKFLPSIINFSDSKYSEIYVIDNQSSDDSILTLQDEFPSVKIVQNSLNQGFAKGYNEGLKKINASYYALVNSDIEVTEGWLEPILEHFEEHPEIAIIQPKILDYNKKDQFEYAGAAGGYIDKFGYAFCRGRIFNSIESDNGQYNDNASISWASGACFFIKSDVFNQLNGFDENYFAHYEEIDLCWRALNLNHGINYVADSTVYHVGGATLETTNPKKTFLNFRNSLLTLVKNAPKDGLVFLILSRLILDGIAGVKYIIELKPKHTFAIIRAHFSFYTQLKNYIKLRNQSGTKLKEYYYITSIVKEFFLKNKKRFSELR